MKEGFRNNLDALDYKIIDAMMNDADVSYSELGKKLSVSGGTIHVRMKKLHELGIAQGNKLCVDLRSLGFTITCFVGVYLEKSSIYPEVAKAIHGIPEVVRLTYTTGTYSMFLEVVCKDIYSLRRIIHDSLQSIPGIERTETLICLEEGFRRNVTIAEITEAS